MAVVDDKPPNENEEEVVEVVFSPMNSKHSVNSDTPKTELQFLYFVQFEYGGVYIKTIHCI